jgi:hypothetical protein
VAAGDYKHSPQGHVLADHDPEFRDFSIAEICSQFCHKCGVDSIEISRHLFRITHREPVSRIELSLGQRQVDLSDGVFIESLTRRRRVACEQSSVAAVEGSDLNPGQLLDPARDDAFSMPRPKKREVTLEKVGEQLGHVETGPFCFGKV